MDDKAEAEQKIAVSKYHHSDWKPNSYIVLCRTALSWTQIPIQTTNYSNGIGIGIGIGI